MATTRSAQIKREGGKEKSSAAMNSDAVYVCTVRMLSGAHVRLGVKGRHLSALSSDSTEQGLPPTATFPHLIRGVFPAAGEDEPTSRAYVLLDSPNPLVEVDVATGAYLTVLSAATQDAYLKRWSSDTSLVSLKASQSGRFVAVGLDSGGVFLHKLCSDHGKPTFEAVGHWVLGRNADPLITSIEEVEEEEEDDVQSIFVSCRRTRGPERVVVKLDVACPDM
jgi:hypothetical protein